jgi:hypothetical protein
VKERFRKLAGRVRWSKAITLVANTALSVSVPKIEDIVGIFGEGEEPEDPTLQGFRDEFAELLGTFPEISRVVVVVDDLDRCLPPSVIATLEAIKLFLSVPKMAFVLAYDDRLVTHATADRYHLSPRATEMASEYLEKIVQIPVPVPTLGLGDTEAYLALTLLETHMSEQEAYKKAIDHRDAQRREGKSRVFEKLPSGLVPRRCRGRHRARCDAGADPLPRARRQSAPPEAVPKRLLDPVDDCEEPRNHPRAGCTREADVPRAALSGRVRARTRLAHKRRA